MEDPLPMELPLVLLLPLDDGDFVLDEELGELVEPEAPLEPELDLLKCASHSARETCPSLFLSTSEKLGADEDEDAPWLLEVPPADEDGSDELLELLPEADGVLDEDDGVDEELLDEGVDEELLDDDGLVADGVDDDDEDCATARDDRANRTAAVMVLRVLGMEPPGVRDELLPACVQTLCR